MGTPHIYWYPNEGGPVRKLNLAEHLSDLQEVPSADVQDDYDGAGRLVRVHHQDILRVRLVLERFGDPGEDSRERELQAIHSHLLRGNAIALSRDSAKTWAAMTSSTPSEGDGIIYTPGNGFSVWTLGTASLAAGDEVVIESEWPDSRREIAVVSSLAGGVQVVLEDGCIYEYSDAALIRWRDFYPVLRLPRDQIGRAIVPHDHRINWTLDVELEYCVAEVIDLYGGRASDSPHATTLGLGTMLGSELAVGEALDSPRRRRVSAAGPLSVRNGRIG